ncbi:MAG: ABC transporter permease [Nanoarchaeota archaeon]
MTAVFTAVFSATETVWDRQIGFLKETLVAPVSRFEIMLGKTLGGATIATSQGIIVFIVCLIAGLRPVSLWLLPLALLFLFLVGFLFTALGMAIASNMEDMQGFPIVFNFIIMPLFFLSGALYPLAGLPKALDIIARFNPLSYGVDGLRGALTGAAHFGMGLDFMILLFLSLVLFLIGSYLFSKVQL